MIDDALALGIKHAALNVNLASLLQLTNNPQSLPWTNSDGQPFYFHAVHVQALDRPIKTLSDSNVIVSLIILAYESHKPELNKVLLHPRYDRKAPNHLGAFNTETPEGTRYLAACIEFLADRYSRSDRRRTAKA